MSRDVGGLAHRQGKPGPAAPARGSPAGAHHDAAVLGGPTAGANLDRAARGRAHREHLVEHDPLAERPGQRVDRGASANHAGVLVDTPRSSWGEQRQALFDLVRIDPVCADAGYAHRLEPCIRSRPSATTPSRESSS